MLVHDLDDEPVARIRRLLELRIRRVVELRIRRVRAVLWAWLGRDVERPLTPVQGFRARRAPVPTAGVVDLETYRARRARRAA